MYFCVGGSPGMLSTSAALYYLYPWTAVGMPFFQNRFWDTSKGNATSMGAFTAPRSLRCVAMWRHIPGECHIYGGIYSSSESSLRCHVKAHPRGMPHLLGIYSSSESSLRYHVKAQHCLICSVCINMRSISYEVWCYISLRFLCWFRQRPSFVFNEIHFPQAPMLIQTAAILCIQWDTFPSGSYVGSDSGHPLYSMRYWQYWTLKKISFKYKKTIKNQNSNENWIISSPITECLMHFGLTFTSNWKKIFYNIHMNNSEFRHLYSK